MAHHVGVGEIHHHGVEVALLDGFHDRIGNSRGAHLRFQVIGWDFGRRNQNAFLAAEGLFNAPVEKIGDVGVFFGFGAAQIFQILLGEDLRQDVRDFFGRDYVAQPRPGLVVLRHGHVEKIFRALGIGKFLEAGLGDGSRHLAGAVGAEIEEDYGVIFANRLRRRERRANRRP